jgi:hypothetical protein
MELNKIGEYVVFSLSWWHHGYYKVQSDKLFFTTQLYAKHSVNPATKQLTLQGTKLKYLIEGCLDNYKLERLYLESLTQDLLYNWDTTYLLSLFPPCKEFEGKRVDRTKNRHIFSDNFYLVPNIEQLVYSFEDQFKIITVDTVWLFRSQRQMIGFKGSTGTSYLVRRPQYQ